MNIALLKYRTKKRQCSPTSADNSTQMRLILGYVSSEYNFDRKAKEKHSVPGTCHGNKSCSGSEREKNSCKLKKSYLPITALVVCPLPSSRCSVRQGACSTKNGEQKNRGDARLSVVALLPFFSHQRFSRRASTERLQKMNLYFTSEIRNN